MPSSDGRRGGLESEEVVMLSQRFPSHSSNSSRPSSGGRRGGLDGDEVLCFHNASRLTAATAVGLAVVEGGED